MTSSVPATTDATNAYWWKTPRNRGTETSIAGLCPSAPADALAVHSDEIDTTGDDLVTAGAATDDVEGTVAGEEPVGTFAAVEPISSCSAADRVVPGETAQPVI